MHRQKSLTSLTHDGKGLAFVLLSLGHVGTLFADRSMSVSTSNRGQEHAQSPRAAAVKPTVLTHL